MASAGKLTEALDAAGLTPEDITHVLFTHGHPDHLWGVLDDFDEPLFANATHMIGRAEFEYWTDPDTVATIGAARTTFAVGAARRLEALSERLEMFDAGSEPINGVTALLTPGHTPGHMSFVVAGKALITGDAISNNSIAFLQPGFASPSDQDPQQAAKTRVTLLDQITAEDLALVGFHLPDGGVGHVERAADGYRFIAG